jgi:hypothetical protein
MKFGMTAGALLLALQFTFPAFAGTTASHAGGGNVDMTISVPTLDAVNNEDQRKVAQPEILIVGQKATPLLFGGCAVWRHAENK